MEQLGVGILLAYGVSGMSAITSADRQMSKLFHTSGALDGQLTSLGKSMVGIASGAVVMAGGIAMINAAMDAGQAYADYEQSLNITQGLLGATREEMAAMEEQAHSLARTTRFTAGDSMDAYYELASAGLTQAEAMATLETTLKGAVIGQMDAADAADMLTTAMRSFQIPAENSLFLMDQLTLGARMSKIHLDEYTHAFGTFGGVMQGTNQSIEDSIALFGLFRTAGMSASRASMMMKMMGTHLVGMSEANKNRMREMGLEIFDQFGEMKALPDIVEELFQKMPMPSELLGRSDISGEEIAQYAGDRLKVFTDLFGMRAVAGILNVQNAQYELNGTVFEGVDAWNAMSAELENANGYTDQYYETVIDGWNEKYGILKASINDAKLSLGQPLLNAAAPYLDVLIEKVNWLGEWLGAHPQIAAAIGSVLLIGGALLALAGGIVVIGGLIGLIANFGTIIGYVALAVAGITIAVGAIGAAGYAIYKYWDVIKNLFINIGNWLWTKFGFIFTIIWGILKIVAFFAWNVVINPMIQAFRNIILPAILVIFAIVTSIIGIVLMVADVIWTFITIIGEFFSAIINWDFSGLDAKMTEIANALTEDLKVLGNVFFEAIWGAIQQLADKIINWDALGMGQGGLFEHVQTGAILGEQSGGWFGSMVGGSRAALDYIGSNASGTTRVQRDGYAEVHEGNEIIQRGGRSNNGTTGATIENVNFYSYGKEDPETFAERAYIAFKNLMGSEMEATQHV